jgi:hypothetical protein
MVLPRFSCIRRLPIGPGKDLEPCDEECVGGTNLAIEQQHCCMEEGSRVTERRLIELLRDGMRESS